MKKIFFTLLSIFFVFVLIICALNISVTTKKGVDYNVSEIKLPLYLKILDFMSRHYNYKNIVVNIIGHTKDDNEMAIKLLSWVNANVQEHPKELPVVDDHPLNILIRGYGVQDQFEDIFTVLCNYAGMEAFFWRFKSHSGNVYYISFVNVNGKWRPLSAFKGVYPAKDGVIASIDDIVLDKKILEPLESNLTNFDANTFLKEIDTMNFDFKSTRAKGQSPWGRAWCIMNGMFKDNS